MSDLWRTIHAKHRQLVILFVVLLGFYVVLPQLGSFHATSHSLRRANSGYVMAAAGAIMLTYLAAAGTYCLLAFRRLEYSETVLVEVASNFVNRLLPAGIGSLGANYAYLRHSRHTKSQAVTVVTANNTIGMLGHFFIMSVVLLASRNQLHLARLAHLRGAFALLALATLLLALAIFALSPQLHKRFSEAGRDVLGQIAQYRHKPFHLVGAFLTSISLTLCNVLSLWYAAAAVGADLSFVTVLIIYSLGIALGTATPSPGGLGGVEAGLGAGFVAYHLTGAQALAAVLLFRLMSYWLPLVIGAVAFAVSQRLRLFSLEY